MTLLRSSVKRQRPARAARGRDATVAVIEASPKWVGLRLAEVWRNKELLYFLTWRDIKVRYKQTVLGIAWAVLQPFFLMVVFTVFFNRLAKISPGGDVPYPIFSYAALVPWTFLANGVTLAGNSLVTNSQMIKKVYFPRLIVPTSAVLSGLVDFVLAFVVLFGMMAYYGIAPQVNALWVPVFVLMVTTTALGVGLWLSAMNVQFRDVRYIIPFLTQIWMFLSPVVYPSTLLQEPWRTIYSINPMVGAIEGFRWALLDYGRGPDTTTVVSATVVVCVLLSGAFYFKRMEKTFADVV